MRTTLLRSGAARTVGVVLVGPRGRVATALRARLSRVDAGGIELRLVGAVDRQRMLWDPAGLDPLVLEGLLAGGEATDWSRLLERVCRFSEPLVLVDCTASPEVAGRYAGLLRQGIGVVTPNKLANAARLSDWRLLRDLSQGAGVPYRYETTVGAALPVLGTVADLRRTGDRLQVLSAVLSGTLAFVLHRAGAGAPFSEAVREAHRRGYTEPHPKEDLSGEDVARKLLILLREAGHGLEREEVSVEPLLPGGLPDEPDPERFLDALGAWDGLWAERAAHARQRGERLLYVASFDGAAARVGVAALPADHPVARGGPGENVIVCRTERYCEVPLTIAGPGAGPEVTATGVLADLIAAAREIQPSWAAGLRPEEARVSGWLF
jgi:aspartokinase/homoserine dehydrogenase 1